MTDAFKAIVENGDRVSSFTLLLLMVAALGYVAYALASGKIPSPGDYKRLTASTARLQESCDKTEETLRDVTAELADSRVLHAGAVVRIEFLEAENRRKDSEISGVSARCARLEAELDVLRRNQWQKSPQEGGTT